MCFEGTLNQLDLPIAMQKLIITGVAGVLIGATSFSTKPSISQGPQPTPIPNPLNPPKPKAAA
jgi:hypothetical protein